MNTRSQSLTKNKRSLSISPGNSDSQSSDKKKPETQKCRQVIQMKLNRQSVQWIPISIQQQIDTTKSSLELQINTTISSLEDKFSHFASQICTEVNNIKSSIAQLQSQLTDNVSEFRMQLSEHTSRIDNTEDDIERIQRNCDLRISGFPPRENENVCYIFQSIAYGIG